MPKIWVQIGLSRGTDLPNSDGYVRLYTFLSQIFDYDSTEVEKRFLFYKRLIALLQFGREREGVDLSSVKLTHHNLKDQGKRDLKLSPDAVLLPPRSSMR